jgi:hypothetical protein
MHSAFFVVGSGIVQTIEPSRCHPVKSPDRWHNNAVLLKMIPLHNSCRSSIASLSQKLQCKAFSLKEN